MKIKYLLVMTLLISSASCASSQSDNDATQKEIMIDGDSKELVLNEGYSKTADGKVLINNDDMSDSQEIIALVVESSQGVVQMSGDSSQVSTMLDGYGNKTETREFLNHPLVHRLVIRTSVNGEKRVFVYGRNGDIKELPQRMFETVLTSPGKEIATSVGIFEGRKVKEPILLTGSPNDYDVLTPLPSNQFLTPAPQIAEYSSGVEVQPEATIEKPVEKIKPIKKSNAEIDAEFKQYKEQFENSPKRKD